VLTLQTDVKHTPQEEENKIKHRSMQDRYYAGKAVLQIFRFHLVCKIKSYGCKERIIPVKHKQKL